MDKELKSHLVKICQAIEEKYPGVKVAAFDATVADPSSTDVVLFGGEWLDELAEKYDAENETGEDDE